MEITDKVIWFDVFKGEMPDENKKVEIETKYGMRIAKLWPYDQKAWDLQDCTHPLQNKYMSFHYANKWRYID